ncbi:hypothetical protein QBC35DRAFT_430438 [Podospora australis]|uniref:Uncharacterized protein n=1 Tax=Podospora australis TaxID=1536484 RepID=A0AAN7AK22_9PEZI|nr:hypothetical protein QBC35DRAFT_430438 [Podospora australis]
MEFIANTLSSTNLSYYTIPVAFFLCMAPNAYAMKLAGKNYDIAHPRRTEEFCAKDTSLDKATVNKISRAKAASANGFETISLYAASIVAANAAKMPITKLNKLAVGYCVSRAVYNYVYVGLQDNRKLAGLRPFVWFAGIWIVMTLFVGAGNALNTLA